MTTSTLISAAPSNVTAMDGQDITATTTHTRDSDSASLMGDAAKPTTTINSSRTNTDDFDEDSAVSSGGTTTTTTAAPVSTVAETTELPDFTSAQRTSTFTCQNRETGYYADVNLDCRVYHFCTKIDGIDGASWQRMSYICLENSVFDQMDLNCVKRLDLRVRCEDAEKEYERSNKQFDAKEESKPSMTDSLAANIMMNPFTRFIAGR